MSLNAHLDTVEQREQIKREHVAYRRAAARLSGGVVSTLVAVNETIDRDCAFVEVTIRVPREEMEKELR
jgi:hypothetical protein